MQASQPPSQQDSIHDERVVEFRPEALVVAMHGFGRGRFGAPFADVHSATPMPDENAVRFRFGPDGTHGEIVLDGARLAALVIGYCSGARIPLPRGASKYMLVTERGVRFDFATSYEIAPEFRSRAARGIT